MINLGHQITMKVTFLELDKNYVILRGICNQFLVWSYQSSLLAHKGAITNCDLAIGRIRLGECVECMTRGYESLWELSNA